jgi:hypothetical protein
LINSGFYVPNERHHAIVQELLTLVYVSQFPSLTVAHFIIVKFPMTLDAQVSGYAVVTFNSTAFAVLVLAHPAIVRSHNCAIFDSAAHTATPFSCLGYLLATDYHLLPRSVISGISLAILPTIALIR